jgi:DNA mismatch repair protein MutS2
LNEHSFRALEFEAIRTLLLAHAGGVAGKHRIQALAPATDPGSVREALARTTEAVTLLQRLGRQPYHDLPDVGALLPSARVAGHFLEPRALLDVASFLDGGDEICARVARAEGTPRLSQLASRWVSSSDVAAAIRRAILPSAEVADDASPRLADTRRHLTRLKSQLTSVMEGYLRGKDADRLLQDKVVTTRNDRYVLLLKAEHRGQIPGIIHGGSGSGASLFVEPLPAVELNNDIVSLQEEERREVVRILRELTARVGERADVIDAGSDILGELDAVQAMALAARDMDAHAPAVDETGTLELLDARHPLLIASVTDRLGMPPRAAREPVPVTVRVGDGEPVLVISGPNTGGKTVTLKTVGLFALMAQCGLHVPAALGSRLPVFKRIFADIGDDQSIAANLSTFSAHLATIVEMTADLQRPALVLLDEVGAGTDPSEGGALGVAIVDYFRQQGAMVVATTHLGLMKAYAQSTAGVGCASFGYDPRTYEPTYRLELGTAGRSLALEMAERLRLPLTVVRDARSRLSEKEAQAEALLKTLEQEKAELEEERERLTRQRDELRAREQEAEARERAAEERRRREVESVRAELRRRSEQMAREAADAIQQAVQRVEQARKSAASWGSGGEVAKRR